MFDDRTLPPPRQVLLLGFLRFLHNALRFTGFVNSIHFTCKKLNIHIHQVICKDISMALGCTCIIKYINLLNNVLSMGIF